MTYRMVEDEATLADACEAMARAAWIGLDTEFVRERTYFARLCLLQLATDDGIWIVDPVRTADVAPLLAILYDPGRLKILHSARQDLEVLNDLHGSLPTPIFDTQLAAAFLGHGDQIGYAALVREFTGHELPKAHTRTDWCQRPLSQAQLDYAAEDVAFLGEIYRRLADGLARTGRRAWFDAECAALVDPALYAFDPQAAYLRVKGSGRLAPAQLGALAELAAWRERTARARNRPRGWIVPDAALVELASRMPRALPEMNGVEGLPDKVIGRHGEELLRAIADGAGRAVTAPAPRRLEPAEEKLRGRLMQRVQERARALDMAAPLLATRKHVGELMRGVPLAGWRHEAIGRELQEELAAMRAGKTGES